MRCYTCKEKKSLEDFETKNSKQCLECKARQDRLCPDCQKVLPLVEFKYKSSDKLYGYCTECRRIRALEYDRRRRSKPEEKLRRLEASRKRDTRAASKAWREQNPDHRIRGEESRKSRGVPTLSSRANRRAKHYGSPGMVRRRDIDYLIKVSSDSCFCSDDHKIDENNPIHIDHIKPLSKGGQNCIHNVQLLCRRCNMKKGTSEFDFRTRETVRAINTEYPECSVAQGRDCCRSEFEIGAGIFIGRPDWKKDSQ